MFYNNGVLLMMIDVCTQLVDVKVTASVRFQHVMFIPPGQPGHQVFCKCPW